jgi:hypothetical protein
MTNPFAQPTTQQAPPAQPQAPAGGNPFGPGVATQQAPPVQQQAAPAAPAYTPPAQQAAPAAPQAPAIPNNGGSPWPAGAVPAFGTPPPPSRGGKGDPAPTLVDIWGRGVLIFPLSVKHNIRHPRFKNEDGTDKYISRMECVVVVLWDPRGVNELQWGGSPHTPPFTPHTNTNPFPYAFKPTWPIEQGKLIEQCEVFLPGGAMAALGQNAALGIVHKEQDANAPWHLLPANPDLVARAEYYISGVRGGQFPNPLAG